MYCEGTCRWSFCPDKIITSDVWTQVEKHILHLCFIVIIIYYILLHVVFSHTCCQSYSLYFFLPKYKSSPCKKVCVTGWMVVLPDDPARPNIFQLNDPDKGQLHTANRAPAVFFFHRLISNQSTYNCNTNDVSLHRQCLQVPDRI